MKFFIQLQMGESGDFPGAPDLFTVEISEAEYDALFDSYIRRRGVMG